MRVYVALLICLLPEGLLSLPTGNYSVVAKYTNVTTNEEPQEDANSAKYVVQMELSVRHVADRVQLTERLETLLGEGVNAAVAKHFRQKPLTSTSSSWNNNITAEILKIQELQEKTWISFVAYVNNAPILGEVVVEDLSLLSASHISAFLHYPFSRLLSQRQIAKESQSRWWIIAVIFASGLLLVLLGWCILCVYYNSCGRPSFPSSAFYSTKAVYIKDEETQSTPPNIVAADTPSAKADAPESSPPLQVIKEETKNKKEPNAGLKTPIPTTPLPLKMPLIVEENSKSMSIDSWGMEEEPKKFEFDADEKRKKDRPKTAGKSRPLRTTDGRIMGTVANTTVWNEYAAADVVAKNFGVQPSISWIGPHDHPVPARPTVEGTVQYESLARSRTSMNQVL